MAEIRDTAPANGNSPLAEEIAVLGARIVELRKDRDLTDAERSM